jgi:hypothetical protein
VAFVPLRPGSYTLPAVRLHWWDTNSDRERVAELPQRQVEVLPALAGQGMPGQTATSSEPTVPGTPVPAADRVTAQQTPAGTAGLTASNDSRIFSHVGVWPWVSLLFASLWLATLLLWWRGRGAVAERQPGKELQETRQTHAAEARSRFLSACRANDAQQARRSLLEWAATHWPDAPPAGLGELARRLDDPQVVEALQGLDRSLYRGDSQGWVGSVLAQRLGKLPKQKLATGNRSPLPDLYA